MKIKNLVMPVAIACLSSLAINVTTQQSVAAKPPTGMLNSAQISKLKKLRIKIAVPTYIPSGFRVANVRTDNSNSGPEYTILYRNANNSCFAIESVHGGVGDIDAEFNLPINSPLFGKSTLFYEKQDGGKNRSLMVAWMEKNDQFYRLAGLGAMNWPSTCRNIVPQQAVRITESLQYLNP